jgi:hypothetical protein
MTTDTEYTIGFEDALHEIKQGYAKRISRSGWNGKGMYIFLIEDWKYTNGFSDNFENLPFLAMKTADNKVVPWLASQTDILADDWMIEMTESEYDKWFREKVMEAMNDPRPSVPHEEVMKMINDKLVKAQS